jgi:hypothetical protein
LDERSEPADTLDTRRGAVSSIEKTRQLAAEALGEHVEVAVVVYRYLHPTALVVGWATVGMLLVGTDRSWVRLAVLFLGSSVAYLLSRPTVVLARTGAGVVALRPALLRPSRPSANVAERFAVGTPTALGPAAFAYRPLTVSYHRYWVHWRQGAPAERLVRTADGRVDRT